MLSITSGLRIRAVFLGNIDNPNPSLEHAAARLIRRLARDLGKQHQGFTAQANHIGRKRMRELREERQAQGCARDEQVQNY